MLMCAALMLTACGKRDSLVTGQQYYNPAQKSDPVQSNGEDGESAKSDADVAEKLDSGEMADEKLGADQFLITINDMQAECLILNQIASGKQYMYYYSVTTQFLDKYGNRTSVSNFEPGRVICVGQKDIQGRLLSVQLSDQVWEYPDVKRYSVDEERGVFTIAESNYSYDDSLLVHEDGTQIALSDLTELDTLRIVGVGKKLISVSVTTGHGELKLANTELFDGSFMQVGSKIFTEITPNMSMELPEGKYIVAVANNGYGGSTEIEIVSGEELVLDLDTLKGEGPKFGEILFAVDVAGAVLRIDGNVVDYTQPVPLQYGVHSLEVTADSYESYSKKLFVNSERATIVIGLSGDDTTSASTNTGTGTTDSTAGDSTVENATATDVEPGSLAGSLAGSQTSGSLSNTTSTVDGATSEAELDAIVDSLLDDDDDDDDASDYLSTLTELLGTLAGD